MVVRNSRLIAQKVPSFLESGVFGFGAVGGEEDFGLSVSSGEGDDVPELGGDNISGDEVEVVKPVGNAVRINVAFVSAGAVAASGGLDLDAEEVGTLAAFVGGGFLRSDQTDVVRGRVSPGTDDGETEFGGAGHEEKLGPFALKLEVRENVVCHLGSQSQKPHRQGQWCPENQKPHPVARTRQGWGTRAIGMCTREVKTVGEECPDPDGNGGRGPRSTSLRAGPPTQHAKQKAAAIGRLKIYRMDLVYQLEMGNCAMFSEFLFPFFC